MTTVLQPEWAKPVVKLPINQQFEQFGNVRQFKNKVGIFNYDRTVLYDVVSKGYNLIPHTEALDLVHIALKESFGKAIEPKVISTNQGARVKATFDLTEIIPKAKVAVGDLVGFRFLLFNSYDRSWLFRGILGALRLVCTNGMVLGSNLASVGIKHYGKMLDDPTYLTEQIQGVIGQSTVFVNTWKEWREIMVDHERAMLLENEFPKRYMAPILEESRYPRSLWDLYNDLTAMSSHQTRSQNRRVQFDDKIRELFYEKGVLELAA